MKILFTGGGTGGHVYPLVAVAREIRRVYPQKNLELYYAGPNDELALILLSQEDFIIKKIISGKVRRYFSFKNFIDVLFKIPAGFFQSLYLVASINPDLVFSKGGSGSIAVTFAARVLNKPVFIHESDIVPGLSNQKTAKWAKKVFVSFKKTEFFDAEKTVLTGNPIRKEILDGDKQKAKDLFNLTYSKPILLVAGGSQGATSINDFILRILNDLLKDFEVIHVAGRENFSQVKKEAQVIINEELEKYYHLEGFLEQEKIKHAYSACDVIVSRAGSSAIFEAAALGKPSILIPLPSSAGDHQSKNAYAYAQAGACLVLEQGNLQPNLFLENLQLLLAHSEKLNIMRESALGFSKPLAARAIAREILEYLMVI